jgi:hypothetical protein
MKIYMSINSMERALLEKLTVTQVAKKFPTFYGTRKIITVFTRVCNESPS